MEEIDKTIKKSQSFVHIVQNSCDSHRLMLDQLLKEEYHKFGEEWRIKQVAAMQEEKTESKQKQPVVHDDDEDSKEKLKMKTLSEADALLRKARKIRQKFDAQIMSNGGPGISTPIGQNKQLMSLNKQVTKHHVFAVTNGRMCSSNSEPILSDIKSDKSSVQHHKHLHQMSSTKSSQNLYRKPVVKTCEEKTHQKARKSKSEDSHSVITKGQLNMYKNLPSTETCSQTIPNKSKHISSQASANKSENGGNKTAKKAVCTKPCNPSLPKEKHHSMKDFNEALITSALKSMNLRPNLSHCLWYPFINTSNEIRLSLKITCSSIKELKHVYMLYHQIQEVLYWIDLYCLVGKAMHVQPVGSHKQNFCIIHSYIESVFHENLQRTPILLPPDSSS